MKQYEITQNDSGQRLDKFLKKLFPNASSSLIYKFNRKNKIKVDKKKQDNEYKLQVGEKVYVYLNDEEIKTLSEKKEVQKVEISQKFDKKNIVYEDKELFIVNKDSGINVHPGDHKTTEIDLITQVRDYLGDKLNSLTFAPSLVHRIDRDTSGILLIAKQKNILTKLVDDFKTHDKVKKVYYAIVLGKLPAKSGKIDEKLLRIVDAKKEDKVQVNEKGQTALSLYKVINEYEFKTPNGIEIISEVEVEIKTGRMHQIRVHLNSVGCPIIGDNKYGNKQFNTYISKNFGLSRQALHAWKIEFNHYEKNKKMSLEARLKPDLINFIKKILNK
ncbi:MAG: RluA family pseudouridine synthase [Candidatus Gracilibacteria bacterium]|nr:RluA family pseudouridine synthase [Candidatus Gracilibacteria bacterium]